MKISLVKNGGHHLDFGKIFYPQDICDDYTFPSYLTNISLTKNGGHFDFSNLFLLYPIFKKNYPSQKWGSLSIFKFVTKSAKHQIASVSLTMQDGATSSKFLKHTLSKIITLPKNHFSYILALLSYKQNFLT